MAELNLVNKATLKRKIISCTLIGASILVGYVGLDQYKDFKKSRVPTKKVSVIETAIEENNFTMAEDLISKIKNDELPFGQKENLSNLLLKKKLMQPFEESIAKKDEKKANYTLAELRKSSFFGAGEISQLEQKVNSFSEDGLFSRIILASSQDKPELCNEYLLLYPNSQRKNTVVKELIKSEVVYFSELLKNQGNYSEIYKKILDINNLLEKHSKSEISIPKSQIEEIHKNSAKYEIAFVKVPEEKEITLGRKVLFVESRGFLNGDYRKERDSVIPLGSVGKVITINPGFCIAFENANTSYWQRKWDGTENCWKVSPKNSAVYSKSELLIGNPLNEFEKDDLKKSIEKMDSLVNQHYQEKGD